MVYCFGKTLLLSCLDFFIDMVNDFFFNLFFSRFRFLLLINQNVKVDFLWKFG